MQDVSLCNQKENMLSGLSQLIARGRSKAQMLMSYISMFKVIYNIFEFEFRILNSCVGGLMLNQQEKVV